MRNIEVLCDPGPVEQKIEQPKQLPQRRVGVPDLKRPLTQDRLAPRVQSPLRSDCTDSAEW